MKKQNYLFKGVTTDILRLWADECAPEIKQYVERIELVDARVKLTPFEAMAARKQINNFNKECGTKLRLLKMKD
ncbi:hypothetical protein [uncultured Eubacterium sp.]|uniref:hypothetical protein n=1 Tax=uncultured Eubacterium sp. TaxID=165185 RepID=UPI0025928131|nr:hypothetical protein [uncultured Eubacterium sp.]